MEIVRKTFRREVLGDWGPNAARKVLQKMNVYTMHTTVSRMRISPKREKSFISVARRGRVASVVVRAELMMETPMKDMAASTRFTRTLAPAANYVHTHTEREREKKKKSTFSHKQSFLNWSAVLLLKRSAPQPSVRS